MDDIANMELEELALFLQKKGKGRFSDPEQLVKNIQKATRDSYRLGKVMQESVLYCPGDICSINPNFKKSN